MNEFSEYIRQNPKNLSLDKVEFIYQPLETK